MANPLAAGEVKKGKRTAQEWCDLGNQRLRGEIPYADGRYEVREHLHWYIENGQPKLGAKLNYRSPPDKRKHVAERDRSNFCTSDWAELNQYLESMGSQVRYGPNGEKNQLA